VAAVVPRPDLPVVLENLLRHLTQGALPADPVVLAVGHPQIGDDARIEPGVHLLARVDLDHRLLAGFLVDERLEPLHDGGADLFILASRGAAPVRLPAEEVDVDVAEPQGVRPGPRPVAPLEDPSQRPLVEQVLERLPAGLLPGPHPLETHETVLPEPGV